MKRYIKLNSDVVEQESTLSFDFIYDGEYDRDSIFDAISVILKKYSGYIVYLDFDSIDYSMYPEYADYSISQCIVTFIHNKMIDSHSITEDVHDALLDIGYTTIGESIYTPDTIDDEDLYEIVEQHDWYDPEGLDTPNPDDIVFTGTSSDCEKWLSNKFAEANKSDYASVEQYIPGEWLQIYYPNAISRVTYNVVGR